VPELSPEDRAQVAFAEALRPLWEPGKTREAFLARIAQLVAEEKEDQDELLDKVGYNLANDAAAVRKLEYHATRRRFLEDLDEAFREPVRAAERITGAKVLT